MVIHMLLKKSIWSMSKKGYFMEKDISSLENIETINKIAEKKNRLQFHLMPPMGWMNDPNGLCFYEGYYHVFFQYSPEDANGQTLKYWGHYRSKNLLEWEYVGITFVPDIPEDKDGVYSGSAFVEDGCMEVFYTGNVKEEGEHDYTYSGRGANVIYAKSEDGIHFTEKEVLLTNADYPESYTCHIRDPKVWKRNDTYYMVLGGRKGKDDGNDDYGAVLLYQSSDKKKWNYVKEMITEKPFGYMWECPDYFAIEDKHILSCCPQGIEKESYRYQNGDLSGYFLVEDMTKNQEISKEEVWKQSDFIEWDRGFDFYAPQTFQDDKGRRILMGWIGLPQPTYTNQTTIEEGWQHCLTLPRELTLGKTKDEEGNEKTVLLQNPVEEMNLLRKKRLEIKGTHFLVNTVSYDAIFHFGNTIDEKCIELNQDVTFSFKNHTAILQFKNETGEGRKERKAGIYEVHKIRLIKDTSLLTIFLNDGECVFTTRYYPEDVACSIFSIQGDVTEMELWEMGSYQYHIL